MQDNYLVIMAGGIGSRFWPYSRSHFPKQFHDIMGVGKSMLTQTADRFEGIVPMSNVYVVTNKAYMSLVLQCLPELSHDQILLEEVGKNTAPCIAYATYKIASRNPRARIFVSPSDQYIQKEEEFRKSANAAFEATHSDDIITIGIVPTRPDTGYGYIQYKEGESEIKEVRRFAEKPNVETARQFLASGDFVWNAGIFVFNALTMKRALAQYLPSLNAGFLGLEHVFYTPSEQEAVDKVYLQSESISIDYGVMEKTPNVKVILGYFGWSDVGTWKSLYEVADKDADSNVIDGQVLAVNTTHSIVKTPKNQLVVLNGVSNLIIAQTGNVLLICHKDDEQKVKELLAQAKSKFGEEFA